jgi:hypothetical protein
VVVVVVVVVGDGIADAVEYSERDGECKSWKVIHRTLVYREECSASALLGRICSLSQW